MSICICPQCKNKFEKVPHFTETKSYFPFCSERCKLIDLGAWASERYVITQPLDEESDDPTPSATNDLEH